MPIRPIRSKRDHEAALREAERLEALLLIEDYERRHFLIGSPDPIDFLLNVMQSRGLSRRDLELYVGSRARVAEALIRGYELKRAA